MTTKDELIQISFGLSGPIIFELLKHEPVMAPYRFWGDHTGWESMKYRWERILSRGGFEIEPKHDGLLVRFSVICSDSLVPFPNVPMNWQIRDLRTFRDYVKAIKRLGDFRFDDDEFSLELCKFQQRENSSALSSHLEDRLARFSINFRSQFVQSHRDESYADIAFVWESDNCCPFSYKRRWRSQAELFMIVKNLFPDACYEYNSSWLGSQKIDIFIPSIRVGIEYQGEQHYHPVEFFGGEDGFNKTVERDNRKRAICEKQDVTLIYWKYSEGISETKVVKKFAHYGIQIPR
jgi:hypothetical protein